MDTRLLSLSTQSSTILVLGLVSIAATVYTAITLVYRLFLHPLSSFPGPRLAAVSDFWKAYFQCTKSFTHELMKLHEVYGKQYHHDKDGPSDV